MKLKYLDLKNCYSLLPEFHGLPVLKHLDECLQGINQNNSTQSHPIDRLVEHNRRSSTKRIGSTRFLNLPLEICQAINFKERTIHTQALDSEEPIPGPPKLHTVIEYENSTSWKTIIPLQFVLKGWGDANAGHQGYIHSIGQEMPKLVAMHNPREVEMASRRLTSDQHNYYYVGITGRNWLLRFSEHIGEVRRGSRKQFHRTWQESLGLENVLYTSSLMDINMTFEEAMNWEEWAVDRFAYGPNGMNMIPGGFKGLKFLHEHRIIKSANIKLEERDAAIAEYVRQNPRKGIPNPFVKELWEDDEFYLKVIGGRKDTLLPSQVRKIRALHQIGHTLAEIVAQVGARNETQVRNVIKRATYDRIV